MRLSTFSALRRDLEQLGEEVAQYLGEEVAQ
jgi:hypothetical protein